ncbi:MAG: FKBP-type peptidyl-prolyl cis-trans isomerase [Pseudomonadota bacterium]
MSTQLVKNNSNITIHFSLTLADGTAVDGTKDGHPMTFCVGDGSMITAFDESILGMAVGEKRQVSLEPRETFGFGDEANYHWIEKDKFDHLKGSLSADGSLSAEGSLPAEGSEQKLAVGLLIEFDTPAGDKMAGTVLEINDDKVLVDFNHPLCGHEVVFSVELVSLND